MLGMLGITNTNVITKCITRDSEMILQLIILHNLSTHRRFRRWYVYNETIKEYVFLMYPDNAEEVRKLRNDDHTIGDPNL